MTIHEPLVFSPDEYIVAALSCKDIHKSFGGAKAVNGASFDIPEGKVTALIGPNGAGKTTVVNILAGAMKSDSGSVSMGEVDVTALPTFKRARRGLIRTFQLSREFGGLTVLENLLAAPHSQEGESLFKVYFHPSVVKHKEKELLERAIEILHQYGLFEVRDSWARELSGGQKRLLEIARAVMAGPSLLILDEPMAGINPVLIDRIGDHILDLKAAGVTVLMIEHNLNVVEKICDHVIVLAEGRTLASGRMRDLRENTEVVRAYLGGVLDARIDS